MKTVEIAVSAEDISAPMSNMRRWLDQQEVEPSIFTIEGTSGRFVVRVSFGLAAQARTFADHFAGRVL
jgi:hypothetical protein